MPQGTAGFEREDALACADVLGGFGVSSDDVRERIATTDDSVLERAAGDVIPDPTAGASTDSVSSGDLEGALRRALETPEHPTAFVRRTIASAPRGVDGPARFWTTAPETQLGDVFAAIDWTFDVRSANGRSLSVDDTGPYRLRVADADGRTRSTTFSFPDTRLGDDNYPALVHTINTELLYGLDCRFVQLSDGTDRWRFALVETDELERLRDSFGERVTVFDRPLLAEHQPAAYVPGTDAADAATAATGEGAGAGADADAIALPAWAAAAVPERSWRDRRLTADAFDADHVGDLPHLHDDGLPHLHDDGPDGADGPAEDETFGEDDDASDVIRFVGDDADADASKAGDETASSGSPDAESVSTSSTDHPVLVPDAEDDHAAAREAADSVVADAGASDAADSVVADADASDDDLDGWSIGGRVDATTRSANPLGDDPVDTSPTLDAANDASGDGAEASDDALSTSGFDWGDDAVGTTRVDDADAADADVAGVDIEDADADVAGVDAENADADDDGFFPADAVASFSAGAKTSRVDADGFGVDAGEQTEGERFAAVGAALAAPERISCRGLLDDDDFLPDLPRADSTETRLSFDDDFDPNAGGGDERETSDGFVWMNESSSVREDRSSASD